MDFQDTAFADRLVGGKNHQTKPFGGATFRCHGVQSWRFELDMRGWLPISSWQRQS
jgi:hypothetical protein